MATLTSLIPPLLILTTVTAISALAPPVGGPGNEGRKAQGGVIAVLPVCCVTFSPDGTRALSTTGETLSCWRLPAGEALRTLAPPNSEPFRTDDYGRIVGFARIVEHLAVDWKRQIAVTGNGRGELRVWDIALSKLLRTIAVRGDDPTNGQGITALALSPDGQFMYSSGYVKGARPAVQVWDLATGNHLKTLAERKGQEKAGYRQIIPLPDGRRSLLVGHWQLVLWDFLDDKCIWMHEIPELSLAAVSADTTRHLTYGLRLLLRDGDGKQVRTLVGLPSDKDSPEPRPLHEPRAMAFVPPSGIQALTGGAAGELALWDTRKAQQLYKVTVARANDPITALAVSPDGKFALIGQQRGTLTLFEIGTRRVVGTLQDSTPNKDAKPDTGTRARPLTGH
jgi:WD40 repeat protein